MNVTLHYTVDGPGRSSAPEGTGAGNADAPILVLGPSLGTTGEIWQPQVAALAEHYRVVRYDHRGHGGSPTPPGPYRLDDLGGDVLALLEALGVDQVALGGLSLGGAVAVWVAAHAPQRITRLLLVATSARFGTPEVWAERQATVRAEGVAAIADGALGRWFPPGYADTHAGVVGWARRQLLGTPAEGYAACCAALAEGDLSPLLGKVTAPTLIIAGAEDPASPPAHAEQLAAGIAGPARVEVVPGAAHLVNVAQPEVVNRLLSNFLGEAAHDR
jgi:3-oxoadipate enol-lactonase